MIRSSVATVAFSLLGPAATSSPAVAQRSHRALVLGVGNIHPALRERFVQLAGGPGKNFVSIPTASSGIRLPSGFEDEPRNTAARFHGRLSFRFVMPR